MHPFRMIYLQGAEKTACENRYALHILKSLETKVKKNFKVGEWNSQLQVATIAKYIYIYHWFMIFAKLDHKKIFLK